MILKLQLTREQFASLADFVASDANQDESLRSLWGEGESPRDVYFERFGEGASGFATILKATSVEPHSKSTPAWWIHDGMDVTLAVSESFRAGDSIEQRFYFTPFSYLSKLFVTLDLFHKGGKVKEAGEDGGEARAREYEKVVADLQGKEYLTFEEQRRLERGQRFLANHKNPAKESKAT